MASWYKDFIIFLGMLRFLSFSIDGSCMGAFYTHRDG
jgi:hypothetical protein